MTLTDFLLARIAEDEILAQAASEGGWVHDGDGEVWRYSKQLHTGWLVSHPTSVSDADHIALHNPARTLAECEAKRRIVEVASLDAIPDNLYLALLGALALPYADHPDYQQEWRP